MGGLTTGGLGQTDIGNKQVIGGISREFYRNIKRHYEDSANWVWQLRSEYKDGGQTRSGKDEDAMWTFEPSAALKVYHDMIKDLDITIVYNQKLNRATGISKNANTINSISMESGDTYLRRKFLLMRLMRVIYWQLQESLIQWAENLILNMENP